MIDGTIVREHQKAACGEGRDEIKWAWRRMNLLSVTFYVEQAESNLSAQVMTACHWSMNCDFVTTSHLGKGLDVMRVGSFPMRELRGTEYATSWGRSSARLKRLT